MSVAVAAAALTGSAGWTMLSRLFRSDAGGPATPTSIESPLRIVTWLPVGSPQSIATPTPARLVLQSDPCVGHAHVPDTATLTRFGSLLGTMVAVAEVTSGASAAANAGRQKVTASAMSADCTRRRANWDDIRGGPPVRYCAGTFGAVAPRTTLTETDRALEKFLVHSTHVSSPELRTPGQRVPEQQWGRLTAAPLVT